MKKYAHSSLIRAYTVEFKQEALRMLSTGQPLHKVTYLMGVSASTLIRWQREAQPVINQQDSRRIASAKRRVYDSTFKEKALQRIKDGQSIDLVSKMMNVSTFTLYNWRRKAQVTTRFLQSSDQSSSQLHKVKILSLPSDELTPGEPLPPVKSPGLDTPRLKEQSTVKRRPTKHVIYEEEFKQRALKKLISGRRINKVAQGMGVSVRTLKNWVAGTKMAENRTSPDFSED